MKLEVPVGNATDGIAHNRNVEIRLRNAEGVPAARALVSLKELKWGC
jgi:hypothetical protein